MSEETPQSSAPGEVPGTEQTVPQQAAAAMAGPDSMKLPRIRSTNLRGSQEQERDFEASYKGLNQWIGTEFNVLKGTVDGLAELPAQMKQIADAVEALGKQEPAPAAAPEQSQEGEISAGNSQDTPQPTDNGTDAVAAKLAQMEAQNHKLNLLVEYIQPGQPGEGLPLLTFRDNIPTVPLALNPDGTVNDQGQRKAVEDFINKTKALQGNAQAQTQQALTQGFTPGVSPGAPTEPTQADQEQEYYRLKELYGSDEYLAMPKHEQDQVQANYYNLHEQVGKNLPGQTEPWMDADDLGKFMNQIKARVGHLEGFMMPKT